MIIAVDPGTRSTGVAAPLSGTIRTWQAEGEGISPLLRSEIIGRRLVEIFYKIEGIHDREMRENHDRADTDLGDGRIQVLIEEGIYRCRGRVIAMVGEIRGVIMAEAWRRGWETRKISVQWWKAFIPEEDREIPKGRVKAYVEHFNRSRGWSCTCTDEVDAALISLDYSAATEEYALTQEYDSQNRPTQHGVTLEP